MLQTMVPFLQIWQCAVGLLKQFYLIVILSIFMVNSAHADSNKVKHIISKTERTPNVRLVSNFLDAGPVLIKGPQGRPSFEEVLPMSTSTLAELLVAKTNLEVKREISLTLNKNETLAKLLKRADFTSNELHQVAKVVSRKINVRKLRIGTKFTIGFDRNNQPLSVRTSQSDKFDHFIFKNKLGAWQSLLSVRPINAEVIPSARVIDDKVKNVVTKAEAESATKDIKSIAKVFPIAKPDLILLLGGNPVSMEGPHSRPSIEEVLPISTSTVAELLAIEADVNVKREISLTLNKNETLADLLKRADFSPSELYQVAEVVSQKINVRKLGIGMSFTIGFDENNTPVAVKTSQSVKFDYFIFKNSFGTWQGLQAIRPLDTKFVHSANVIDGTLYEAALEANVPLSTLDNFMRVMGFSVDFQRQLRQGDAFEVVYEKITDRITGEALSVGKIHYVGMVLSGKQVGYYRHENNDGSIGWYNKVGKSAVRTLMRTPVSGARLASSYGMRKHPITGYNKLHRGVDFAVPTGTPILAAGSGRIEMAGWNGSYGRYIRIRHNNTYQTAYAHMSGIAKGIYAGAQVDQGQIIGFVGSTGRSTGPHLHYEILVNSRQVNPMTINLPTGKNLPEIEQVRFQSIVNSLHAYIRDNDATNYAGVTLN